MGSSWLEKLHPGLLVHIAQAGRVAFFAVAYSAAVSSDLHALQTLRGIVSCTLEDQ